MDEKGNRKDVGAPERAEQKEGEGTSVLKRKHLRPRIAGEDGFKKKALANRGSEAKQREEFLTCNSS